MKARTALFSALAFAGSALCSLSPAYAVPVLQLYLEGSSYDDVTDTWILDGTATELRLWAIGNVAGPGSHGAISDVNLSIVYDESAGTPVFTLTSGTTGGYGGFVDAAAPVAATYTKTVDDGSVPKLSDGSDLPSHDEYGDGKHWQEWFLGDFTATTDTIADFSGLTDLPTTLSHSSGQINVYRISMSGATGPVSVHFDLYNHVQVGKKAQAKFAPFSHDAGGTVAPVPPAVAMLATGVLSMMAVGFRRKREEA